MVEMQQRGAAPGSQRGELAKERLLQAAIEEFGARALEGARTRAIAERSGQNISAIQYYFGGKTGLYMAIAHTTTQRLRGRLDPLLERSELFYRQQQDGPVDTDGCIAMVLELCQPLLEALVGDESMASLGMILMREQMRPTDAFEVYYEAVMRPVHTHLTRYVALLTGLSDKSSEAVALAHALIGQVLVFRTSREALIRRAGWKHVGKAQKERMFEAASRSLRATLQGHILAAHNQEY
jgi:AcrR family transcriptional regulator